MKRLETYLVERRIHYELTLEDVSKIRNAGTKTIEEIVKALDEYGFNLKPTLAVVKLVTIKSDFATTVISEMLPVIYSKCEKRTKQYSYRRACVACPYRGTGGSDCMFNLQPRIWVVEK